MINEKSLGTIEEIELGNGSKIYMIETAEKIDIYQKIDNDRFMKISSNLNKL